MEHRIPKKGEIYRHFKGNLYEIIVIARDSETLEEKVVYKEVDGPNAYVRSLPMFVSLVDKNKYPNVAQKYRFELVEQENCVTSQNLIMSYLDIDTAGDKIEFLLSMKDEVNENFLEVVAQSLEFVENPGSVEERYDAIIKYLRTLSKYEAGRLR